MKTINHQLLTAPVNKVAAKVIGKGQHYEKANPHISRWHNPPKVSKILPGMLDLAGVKFGRMTVIGYLAPIQGRKSPAVYLVKCACGWYEVRRAKAIRNPKNVDDCCEDCRTIKERQRYYNLRQKFPELNPYNPSNHGASGAK